MAHVAVLKVERKGLKVKSEGLRDKVKSFASTKIINSHEVRKLFFQLELMHKYVTSQKIK